MPTSAGDARRFVGSTLRSWHCDGAAEVAVLLVSELVTNAVLHARSDLDLAIVRTDRGVRVEVVDTSPVVPVLRHHDDEAMTGRGLALVQQLADTWGVEQNGAGKTVWFEIG